MARYRVLRERFRNVRGGADIVCQPYQLTLALHDDEYLVWVACRVNNHVALTEGGWESDVKKHGPV